MKKFFGALAACLLALGALPWATAYTAPIQAGRAIAQTGREDGREFTLKYTLWTEGWVSHAQPGLLLLSMDGSQDALGLCSPPQGQAYAPGAASRPADSALYRETEEGWSPARLVGGVWRTAEGEAVGTRGPDGDVFSVTLRAKGAAQSKWEAQLDALEGLLDKLARHAPGTEVAILCGGEVWGPAPASEGKDGLLAQAEGYTPQGAPQHRAALEQAAGLAEGHTGALGLALLSCQPAAPAGDQALACQASLQRIREAGGRSFVGVCASPGAEGAAGWDTFASTPAEETVSFWQEGSPAPCLEQAYRHTVGAREVEIIERLDPRFTLSAQARQELAQAGARAARKGGAWEVAWEAELPRSKGDPWEASLTLEACGDFPGGNGVPVSREGSGAWQDGGLLAAFPPARANVGVSLALGSVETEIFLGEAVPTQLEGESVEALLGLIPPAWQGQARTGAFSYQWETEEGTLVGPLGQLGKLIPQASTSYRLQVAFQPLGSGAGAAGPPVGRATAEGAYQVRVVPGTLRVRAAGPGTGRDSRLPLSIEGAGQKYTVTALPEADPQGGGLVLEAQLTGLPYGVYTVTPLPDAQGWGAPDDAGGIGLAQAAWQAAALMPTRCLLGVCQEDDTVDVSRRYATASIPLPPSPSQ